MATIHDKPGHKPARYRPGDRVKLLWGYNEVEATILEDRGPLGVGGRRLYRITMTIPPAEPMEFELPEEKLFPAGTEPPDANGKGKTAKRGV